MASRRQFEEWTTVNVPPDTVNAMVSALLGIYSELGPFKMKIPIKEIVRLKDGTKKYEFVSAARDLVKQLNYGFYPHKLTSTYQIINYDMELFQLQVEPTEWLNRRKMSRRLHSANVTGYESALPQGSFRAIDYSQQPRTGLESFATVAFSELTDAMSSQAFASQANLTMSAVNLPFDDQVRYVAADESHPIPTMDRVEWGCRPELSKILWNNEPCEGSYLADGLSLNWRVKSKFDTVWQDKRQLYERQMRGNWRVRFDRHFGTTRSSKDGWRKEDKPSTSLRSMNWRARSDTSSKASNDNVSQNVPQIKILARPSKVTEAGASSTALSSESHPLTAANVEADLSKIRLSNDICKMPPITDIRLDELAILPKHSSVECGTSHTDTKDSRTPMSPRTLSIHSKTFKLDDNREIPEFFPKNKTYADVATYGSSSKERSTLKYEQPGGLSLPTVIESTDESISKTAHSKWKSNNPEHIVAKTLSPDVNLRDTIVKNVGVPAMNSCEKVETDSILENQNHHMVSVSESSLGAPGTSGMEPGTTKNIAGFSKRSRKNRSRRRGRASRRAAVQSEEERNL